jgi:hypothetical protein
MKKILIFISFIVFATIFFTEPKNIIAVELNCKDTGISGVVLNKENKSVGTVYFGLTGAGDNAQSLNSNDGKFNFSFRYNEAHELKLSYNFPNNSIYESANVILSQCLGNIIIAKEKPLENEDDTNKKSRCGDPCYDNPEKCKEANDGCTVCSQVPIEGNPYLNDKQRYKCQKPEPEETEKATGAYELCLGIKDDEARKACFNCVMEKNGAWTALGCIPVEGSGFTNWIVKFSIGIGGGIAFLLMLFGAFQIILSGGNPDRIKAGREMITAAIGGLLLIIFSVLILRIIGVDLLAIPGFKK